MNDLPHREQLELRRQRCVDGELTSEGLRDYLTDLPDESPEWRELALAFVESQQLARALRAVHGATRQAAPPPPRQIQLADAGQSRKARRAHVFPGFSIAGALLCAVALGWYFGSQSQATFTAGDPGGFGSERQSAEYAESRIRVDSPPGPPETTPALEGQDTPLFQVVMESQDEFLTIPVLPRSQDVLRQRRSDSDPLPASFINQLQEDGYELVRQHELITLPLDDGRHIAVPVETIDVRHRGL